MKLYNRDLEQIKSKSRESRMQSLVEEVIDFLNNEYGIDRQILQEKAKEISFVERKPNETHFVEYNGQKEEVTTGKEAASFVTHKSQIYNKRQWTFENAIYTSDINSNHTIKHELFHYFSGKLNMEFNDNNIGYDKSGVEIQGYDIEDNLVDSSINAKGLNEGITELLAQKLDKVSTLGNNYAYQVSVADILISNKDKSLIKAYFSENEKDFRSFLEKFDKRQAIISSNDLVNMLASDTFDNLNKDLFKGCIEYTLSFCATKEEFDIEKSRLLSIVENVRIADYKHGTSTKEYLLNTIDTMEKTIEENTNEYDKVIRQGNTQSATLNNQNGNPKMNFVKNFIEAYNNTEQEYQYEKRAQNSLADVKRVHDILKTKGKDGRFTADLDSISVDAQDKSLYNSEEQVCSMARLLKAAELLTNSQKLNPTGRNYLEELTNIPNIEIKLREFLRDSKDKNSYMYHLKQTSKENRMNGNIPSYPLTEAEIEALDTPPVPLFHGMRQEMGVSSLKERMMEEEKDRKKLEEDNEKQKITKKQAIADNDNLMKQKKIFMQSVKNDVAHSEVTINEINDEQQEIAERNEMKRLQIIGCNRTEEQEKRYAELQHIYQTNKNQLNQQMQGNGMNR